MNRIGKRCYFSGVQLTILFFLALVSLFFFMNVQPYRMELTNNLNPANLGFLQNGEYTLEIVYKNSPKGNRICIYSEEMADTDNSMGVLFKEQELEEGTGIIRIPLSLESPAYGVCIRTVFDSGEQGYLAKVNIQSNHLIYKDNYALCAIVLLGCAVLAALFYYDFRQGGKSEKPCGDFWLLLTGMGLLASLPLFSEALVWGDDTAFNLVRLEGIYQAMASGDFPVRITPQQMSGYGTLTASMYPQLFLYPAAFLRFFGVSLILSYKILLTATNIATACIAYCAAKNVCGSHKAGLWMSILYTFSIYRLSNMYVRGALGETLAMMFLPLVVWGVYEVLWGKRRWIILVLGVTGVLESHVLSMQLCALFMAVELLIWLFSRKKEQFGRRFWDGCKAVGVTILLNAGFLVPFLYFCGEDFQCFSMPFEVSEHVAYFSQLFTLFPSVNGASLQPGTTQNEMPISVGGVLLGGVLLFLLIMGKKEESQERDRVGLRCLIYGTLSLLMASWLFPWDKISQVDFLRFFFTSLQFSWRFLGPATVFWSFTAAVGISSLTEKNQQAQGSIGWVYGVAAILVIVSTSYFFDSLAQNRYQRSDKMEVEGMNDADGMYLYRDSEVFRAIQLDYSRREANIKTGYGTALECSDYQKNGSHIYAVVAPVGNREDILMFPLYWFPGYEITVNGEKTQAFAQDTLVACKLPPERSVIEVRYAGMWFFRLGDVLTLAAFCGILLYGMSRLRRTPDFPT